MTDKQPIQNQPLQTEKSSLPVQTPLPPTPNKNKSWPLIFLIVLLFGSSITLAYKYYMRKQQLNKKTEDKLQTQITQPPVPETTDSADPQPLLVQKSYIENTDISNQKKYVNPELGISFLYLEHDDDGKNKTSTKQIGNKIYVYDEAYSYDSGQYVEIFNKEPSMSLEETLKKVFLEGYSTNDCVVVAETLHSSYPTSYVQANIKVPGEFTDMEEMSTKWQKCPKDYTQTNGMSFFLMDQNHSDKFAFFSIGQYGISANKDDTLWQDTVEFIN